MHQTPRPYTGGPQTASVFATDTIGIRHLYGLNSSLPNLIASAHRVDGTVTKLWQNDAKPICRGNATFVDFTVDNSGHNATGNFGVRIRLTTDPSGSGGVIAQTYPGYTCGMCTTSPQFSFTVPTSLANGTYYVFLELDYGGAVQEIRKTDNITRSGRTLKVSC